MRQRSKYSKTRTELARDLKLALADANAKQPVDAPPSAVDAYEHKSSDPSDVNAEGAT